MAITNAKSAQAARAGAYDGLQGSDYYGGYLFAYGDLPTEDVEHTGTWSWFAAVDGLNFRADNSGFADIRDGIYTALGRADVLIERLLGVEPNQTVWPIPQSELDVAPNLEQNPGY